MKSRLVRTLAVLLLLLVVTVPAAHAVLQRMGPVDPANGGYPAWYQDTTGLVMDFCEPINKLELDGGWCGILAANLPNPTALPETPFTNYSVEHFYWLASAGKRQTGLLTLALEGSFATGIPAAGGQITFGRLRIVIGSLPVSGDYKIYTPFGDFTFPGQVAGNRLFFTSDIGLTCQFDCVLATQIGPFLLPSLSPGGAEIGPVTVLNPVPDPANTAAPTAYPGTGRSYIADPARLGPVTGSPLPPFTSAVDGLSYDHNRFRIEANGTLISDEIKFQMSGRVFEAAIGGSTTVDRASYARSATATKVDVYATAFATAQGRIPAGTLPATVPPSLSYFDAPCGGVVDPATGIVGPPYTAPVGLTANQMLSAGSNFFGESHPPAIPTQVCVQTNTVNAAGQTVAAFLPVNLGDQVFITEALYDPVSFNFSVKATSSDQPVPPLVPPTLTVVGFGAIDPLTGQLVTPALLAPPANAAVRSSAGGLNQMQVSTGPVAGTGGGSGTPAPVALNDEVQISEDCQPLALGQLGQPHTACIAPAVIINVLSNDTNAVGGTVTLASQPLLGTATVNPDNTISYTPKLDANMVDTFTYTVTVGTQTSNAALITVYILPVNDQPVAVNDSIFAAVNKLVTFNVLANDTDPDGATDLANAVIAGAWPAGLGAQPVPVAGSISFTPTSTGTFSFTYRAQDKAGALSANAATVTVTVSAADNIVVTKSQYVVAKNRWVVSGTDSIPGGQTLSIRYANGSLAGFQIGTAVVDALGNWLFDQVGLTGQFDPRTSGATKLTITSPFGGTATATINLK